MNKKHLILVIALLGLALLIGRWRYGSYEKTHPQDPLGTRLTFDYQGTVGGLFETLAAKSGAQYQLDPAVANRPIQGSFKNFSLIQIQQVAAKQARLRYRPPAEGGHAIRVDSK